MTVSKTSISLPIAVIGKQALIRESLAKSIRVELGCDVKMFEDAGSLQNMSSALFSAIIILDIGGASENNAVFDSVDKILCSCGDAKIILIRDSQDIDKIKYGMQCGIKGYILSSIPFDIAVRAVSIVLAGGIYIPANEFLSGVRINESHFTGIREIMFTPRENDVVEALRKGKPNKVIAHELNMSESTVKVHVHNIMKKLHASNRTEVAMKFSEYNNDAQ